MKLTMVLLAVACLQASAGGYAQTISLSVKNAPLESIFLEIQKQTGYGFVYQTSMIRQAKPVTLDVKHGAVDDVLKLCMKDQPFTYAVTDKLVILKEKLPEADASVVPATVRGRVVNENGEPVAGVTVQVKGTRNATTTDAEGEFMLSGVNGDDILVVSGAETQTQEIRVNGRSYLQARVSAKMGELDQVVMMAYGQTTRRLSTGNISKITAETITKQPVSNPLLALQGRVAGLDITSSSGLPGASLTINIRGKNSLKNVTQPLIIVDGVPLMMLSSENSLSTIGFYNLSPFNSINPADIESMEILKDGDATAIYGSQGASGVILITTKKGTPGKTKLDINYYRGAGQITRSVDLLNTQQYLQMRREAFVNDGVIPTTATAPDLLVWDTTKYTDWKDKIIGGTAKTNSLQVSLSGGSTTTQFNFSANYFSETTVFPDSKPNQRGSGRLTVNHASPDNKFRATFTSAYSVDSKKMPYLDLTTYIFLAPNAPDFYDSTGKLNWVTGLENPMSFLKGKYASQTNNLITSASLQYKIIPDLRIMANLGYDRMQVNENRQRPISSQRPSTTTPPTGSSRSAGNNYTSWIIEPQMEYRKKLGSGQLTVLGGLTWQERKQRLNDINATLYTNDDLLGVFAAAPKIAVTNTFLQYNYNAVFGRLTYNLKNRYILNGNFRRDGSSRFGPANRFSNFGALGGAWIFSEEGFIKKALPLLSYGKIRGSYGITGNDQIADYLYIDLWSSSTTYQYQGSTGVLQQRLFNPYLQWERNKKIEISMDLGFVKDRILLSTSYYRNRSDNQLVVYTLPSQTGFLSIQKNLDALIQNNGWEFQLNTININKGKFKWESSANLTIPKNKLIKYPGLEDSPDKTLYAIGEPLSLTRGYVYLGINPTTGVYQVQDLNGDGSFSSSNDYVNGGLRGSKFFGGLSNTITYGNWSFDIFFQFKKQTGNNYLTTLATAPGIFSASSGNQPTFVLKRWQHPGDPTPVQLFTASTTSAAYRGYTNYRNSLEKLSDASFISLKNLSVSYAFSQSLLKKWKVSNFRIYVQGQNLATFTNYKGADPETQNVATLPIIKIFTAGVQLTL